MAADNTNNIPESLRRRTRRQSGVLYMPRGVREERISNILQKARENPTWGKAQLREWIKEEYQVTDGHAYSLITAAAKRLENRPENQ